MNTKKKEIASVDLADCNFIPSSRFWVCWFLNADAGV